MLETITVKGDKLSEESGIQPAPERNDEDATLNVAQPYSTSPNLKVTLLERTVLFL